MRHPKSRIHSRRIQVAHFRFANPGHRVVTAAAEEPWCVRIGLTSERTLDSHFDLGWRVDCASPIRSVGLGRGSADSQATGVEKRLTVPRKLLAHHVAGS